MSWSSFSKSRKMRGVKLPGVLTSQSALLRTWRESKQKGSAETINTLIQRVMASPLVNQSRIGLDSLAEW